MQLVSRVAAAMLFLQLAIQPAAASRFWLGGLDPVTVKAVPGASVADYMALFDPGSPWQQAAASLSVFKVSAQFVLSAPDRMLRAAFNGMVRRHVQMAIEMGAVIRLDACGKGEGYAPPGMAAQIGARLHRLNLPLAYVALDEPVWDAHEKTWGHAAGGAPNCAYPLPVVADRVAMSVAAIRRYFPATQVGDIEVVTPARTPPRQLIADYVTFANLLQAKTGRRMAFFHADVAWHDNGASMLVPLQRSMAAIGVPFGVIIGGSPNSGTSIAWNRQAIGRLRAILAKLPTQPDDIVVQSWQRFPTRMLPATDPGTATYLLHQAEGLAPGS